PRFRVAVPRNEIQFQPGTYLIRAAIAQNLLKDRASDDVSTAETGTEVSISSSTSEDHPDELDGQKPVPRRLTISLGGVPSAKARDVVRGAVLPLAKANPVVEVDIVIRVDGGTAGVGPEDLDLSIIEGLRQLGLSPEVQPE